MFNRRGRLHRALIITCLIVPAAAHRLWLSINPYTNFDPFGYNVPHLFTGIVLMMLGGVPLAVITLSPRLHLPAAMLFTVGLSLALDEWVYLIATDGSDDEYLLPVSWWGAAVMIALSLIYAGVWWLCGSRCAGSGHRKTEDRGIPPGSSGPNH